MTDDRLTRAELAWLLAQEARGAAKALREKVSELTLPVPQTVIEVRQPALVDNLDALESAIDALSDLQQRGPSARRTRIDVASLVGALAPHARMALEPGPGTEVFADEGDLRRMLHVLLCPTSGGSDTTQSTVIDLQVRGAEDFVAVSVPLGPDRSSTAELERRWLGRMASRLGGRLELASGEQTLYLPTGGASGQHEVHALRRELEQAQQLGEAYARELAEVFASSIAPPPGDLEVSHPLGREKLDGLRSAGAAIVRRVRPLLDGLQEDIEALRRELGPDSPAPRALAQRTSSLRELVAELSRVAACPVDEPPVPMDVAALCRSVADEAEERAARHGVRIEVDAPEVGTVAAPGALLTLLVRSLLDHAIEAAPRESVVELSAALTARGLVLCCLDAGPSVPVRAHDDLLRHRVDPTSLGRPAGVGLLVIDALRTVLEGTIGLQDGPEGGLVVRIALPAAL